MKRVAFGELHLGVRNSRTRQLAQNPAAARPRVFRIYARNPKGLRGAPHERIDQRERPRSAWQPLSCQSQTRLAENSLTLALERASQLATRLPFCVTHNHFMSVPGS